MRRLLTRAAALCSLGIAAFAVAYWYEDPFVQRDATLRKLLQSSYPKGDA